MACSVGVGNLLQRFAASFDQAEPREEGDDEVEKTPKKESAP
jgi:hypothetical protein